MCTRRLVPFLLPAALPLALGCMALTRERPLPVLAIDAETRQPIRGAGVQLDYAVPPPAWAAVGASGTTGGDGVARLWAAPGDTGVTVHAAAPGYLPDERGVPAAAVQGIEPAGLFEAVDRRPAAVVVELCAEPRPVVELVLPAGFRGQVRAEVRPHEGAPATPGQRLFSAPVPPDGAVRVDGPAILTHVFATDYRLRFADHAPLSRNAKESEVGYWWLTSDGDAQVFFVGTQGEFDAARRALGLDEPGAQRPSRGGGGGNRSGGGRRGGRRGGGPPPSGAPAT
jgi:hypothetical protein